MARESPYWNPKTETLDRERLKALQLVTGVALEYERLSDRGA